MAELSLKNLNTVIEEEQRQHKQWVTSNLPSSLKQPLEKANPFFSILEYPEYWSGNQYREVKIAGKETDEDSCKKVLEEIIAEKKAEYQDNPEQLEAIKVFEKKYNKQFKIFTEQSLLLAVKESIQSLLATKNHIQDNDLNQLAIFFNRSGLLKLKTKGDVSKANGELHALCTHLASKPEYSSAQDQEKLKQIEVLGRRLLDHHYNNAEKSNFTDRTLDSIANTSSVIGLATGIPAAILFFAGLAFPPLLVASGILGSISFISYTSTAISAGRAGYSIIKDDRYPSPEEVKSMRDDAVLLPLNIFGGNIFKSIRHVIKNGKAVVSTLGKLWNNVVSNVFPDVFETKEVAKETKSLVSDFRTFRKTQILDHPSTNTFANLTSVLIGSNDAQKVIEVVKKTKQVSKGSEFNKTIQALQKDLNELSKSPQLKQSLLYNAIQAYLTDHKESKSLTPGNNTKYEQNFSSRLHNIQSIRSECRTLLRDTPQLTLDQRTLILQISDKADQLHDVLLAEQKKGNVNVYETAKHSVNTSFVRLPSENNSKLEQDVLATINSYHAHIISWDDDFVSTGTSKAAENVLIAVDSYKTLDPDARLDSRQTSLREIVTACNDYLQNAKDPQSRRRPFVEKLKTYAEEEIKTIDLFKKDNLDNENVVLVSHGLSNSR